MKICNYFKSFAALAVLSAAIFCAVTANAADAQPGAFDPPGASKKKDEKDKNAQQSGSKIIRKPKPTNLNGAQDASKDGLKYDAKGTDMKGKPTGGGSSTGFAKPFDNKSGGGSSASSSGSGKSSGSASSGAGGASSSSSGSASGGSSGGKSAVMDSKSNDPSKKEVKQGFTDIPPELSSPMSEKAKFYFDYDDVDLSVILTEISEKMRINFILGDKAKGQKITIRCPNPITRHEAWLAFLSALQMNSLTIVKVGKFYKIIPFKDAINSPSPIMHEKKSVGDEESAITYIYHLKFLAIKDIEPILRQLKSKDGEVVAFLPTNSFIITDSSLNVKRMLKLLEQLDVPGQQDHIHIIEVYYANVADLANQINQIFGDKAGGKNPTIAAKNVNPSIPNAPPTGGGGEGDKATLATVTKVIPDERTGQIIIVCPDAALSAVLGLVKELDVPIPGEGQVHIYYLENANAEDVATTLQNLAQGSAGKKAGGQKGPSSVALFEGEVKVTADKATNSLVVTASIKDFTYLKKVVRQLDVRRRQVFVEAVIMEISLSKNRQLGVGLNGGVMYDVGGESVPIFGATTFGTLSSLALDPTALQGLAIGLKGPDLKGTEGLILPGVSLPSFGIILQALQTDSNANVLSTPHILCMDNEDSQIVVGSNVPFITGQSRDYNNRPILQIQRQDVALTMKLKPQINESDYVKLTVEQEITELVSISETLGPTTTKRAAKTVVVVKDGQTVVIGGLMKDKTSEDVSKIPFLGDIPVLGRLFRTTRTSKDKANLLIFLTPYIIKDETDFQKIFKRKMRERSDFLKKFYGKSEQFEPPVDFEKKVGAIESIKSSIKLEQEDAESSKAEKTYFMHEQRKVKTLGGSKDDDDKDKAKDPDVKQDEAIESPDASPVEVMKDEDEGDSIKVKKEEKPDVHDEDADGIKIKPNDEGLYNKKNEIPDENEYQPGQNAKEKIKDGGKKLNEDSSVKDGKDKSGEEEEEETPEAKGKDEKTDKKEKSSKTEELKKSSKEGSEDDKTEKSKE